MSGVSSFHKFDRRVPAPLPMHRMLAHTSLNLPSAVDLRAWCGPTKDQGAEGSCTGHAGTSAVEWIFRKYFNKQPVFSPQYTYVKELIAQGDFPRDAGSDGTTLCGTLITSGCCDDALYPYAAGQIVNTTTAQDLNAAQYRMGAFHGLKGAEVALSVLGDAVPWPVEIGFTVYESFQNGDIDRTGVMVTPGAGELVLGGHETLIVGYDIGATATLRPATCPLAVLVQNSYGVSWGLSGFFWMPLSVLDALDTDLKIVHSGRPWKPA